MSFKESNQLGLLDGLTFEHAALKELDSLEELIDWPWIASQLNVLHPSKVGKPAYPPLMMFKALLLQHLYHLSDVKLENQLARDLMFRRFVGLGLSDSVPDHSTISRFRSDLRKANLLEQLFKSINISLQKKKLKLNKGSVSIIDASVVEAQRCRPNKDKDGKTTQDSDASWNVKVNAKGKRESTYGFKAHINSDEDGFVQKLEMTTGKSHDSQTFAELFTGEEEALYADSAYQSEKSSKLLKEKKIKNRIMKRAYRNRPLTKEDKIFNKLHAGTRSIVEGVFGVMKLHQGLRKARYVGLDRNRAGLYLMCIAHNLKRAMTLNRLCTA